MSSAVAGVVKSVSKVTAVEKVLISSCLLGQPVRYDGHAKALPTDDAQALITRWQQEGRLINVCPEMAGDLGCPRPAAEIQGGQGEAVLAGQAQVLTEQGNDVSAAFIKGAQAALALCQRYQIKLAILKARSPSCGAEKNYDGAFSGTLVAGDGVTAALLKQHQIKLFDETQLDQAAAYLSALEQKA